MWPSLTPRVAANEWGHAALFAVVLGISTSISHIAMLLQSRHKVRLKKKLGKKKA